MGARGGVVSGDTTLQAWRSWVRFPMTSLDFSSDLILPVAPLPWGRLSLYKESSWGSKRRPARKADNVAAICEPIV
jgi:hypothetical protein